jgi:outer membrane cobalamin receptor
LSRPKETRGLSSRTVSWGACALLLSHAPGASADGQGTGATGAASTEAPAGKPILMEEVLVRLPRSEASGDPTASATVVDAARFAGEAKDVAALVATAPGVAVSEYGGLGQLATVSIRGSGADAVLVLLDGLPLNTAFGGGVDLSSIPRSWIERIEVVRGPEGAHYGAGALGGVVNVVTRRAVTSSWSAQASAGSFDSFGVEADRTFAAGGGVLLAGASAEATGGRFPYDHDPGLPGGALVPSVRENNAAQRAAGILKLGRPLADGRLDALLQVSAGHRELPGFADAPTPWAWQDDGRVVATVRLARGLPGGATLAARGHLRLDLLDTLVTGPTDAPARQRGGGSGLALQAMLPHRSGLLAATAELAGELVQADGLGQRRERLRAALALSEDLLTCASRLRVAPALRLETDGGFTGYSASLGLGWRLADGLGLRASAGRTFRAPGLAELYLQQGLVAPNPDLQPEEGLAADAALVADGPLGLLSLGGHVTRYHDLIIYQPSDAFGRLKPFNSGEAFAGGLEAEAASAPLGGPLRATLAASYTLLVTELLRGSPAEVGHWLPYRPRHRLYARAGIAPGPLALHLESHYVGLRYQDLRNVNPIPASLVWNAGASWLLSSTLGVRLHVEVKNLADDRTLNDGFGNPLPSRMLLVTLRGGATPQEGTP